MKRIPLARILVAYLAGILGLLQGLSIPFLHHYFGVSLLALVGTAWWRTVARASAPFRDVMYSISLAAFLFLLAFESAFLYDARTSPDHYTHYSETGEQLLLVTVSDIPVSREKTLKVPCLVNAIQHHGSWQVVHGQIVVYVKQPFHAALTPGDEVMVQGKLSALQPPQNPGEVNYQQILGRKNLFHTAYVLPAQFIPTGRTGTCGALQRLAFELRSTVVNTLRHAGLSQDAFSICAALLIGYDDEIDGTVMQQFSHSGTLHILSVSGMHTGILYAVLSLLVDVIDRQQRFPRIRAFVVIAVLLLFSAVTGFSPSVLRASLMLSLVLVGKAMHRQGNSYNTLLFSAFLLLFYDPYLIADVGFLLSYLAVFGIMYLYPIMRPIWMPENRLLKFCWELTLMSVAATLFTLPLTLYCFHQFPLWFIASNLLVIPLSTALMAVAFLLLLCYRVLVLKAALVWLANLLTGWMLRIAGLTDHASYGYIDEIAFDGTDVFFCSLLIILLLWFVSSRSYRSLVTWLVVAIAWTTVSVLEVIRHSQEAELVVFSIRHKACYLLRNGREAWLHADTLTDVEWNRHVKPYVLRFQGLRLQRHGQKAREPDHRRVVGIATAGEGVRPRCRYLVVSHNSLPDSTVLEQIKPLVIADCSNSYTFVEKLRQQCAMLGIPFYSVKEHGALVIPL